ncbi:imidazoleglycerol-phosphate dehydratase HisB [Pelotomaculum terephthalicicum JT]|uniref:imidazoleglycerol-phosphate dehydratase HisB n=1 Tax=Pelotomaculum terephthalicicum TaxID=206393 RepID=UPI0009D3404E|nr:imidazoleglycerol-phosphate dehydratase HisB [Pelotomaculum terephthalicicum]MCG9967823.1 imidazoleglycerol-phosphate dehydratase HisB [Pelotomaculum terephthalicicum JT]OPY62358.1 MAG: Imidazoleglycerol-phosphate dehydratase [Pelotomaculum sp. PtaU1.Bin065]
MSRLRKGTVSRKTGETEINLTVDLDGTGAFRIQTGLPFFEHMLQLFAKHASFDLEIAAQGDLAVDGHHTVEDAGICLGRAIKEALGGKQGIKRYGSAIIPMDEALALVAVDLSGRGFLAFDAPMPAQRVGDFETELVEEFLRAVAMNGEFNLHVRLLAGKNTHHIIESIFKALGHSLREAVAASGMSGIPTTKGVL